ncbi:phosphatase PAP2 family protein [Corynebacterium sp. 13CS0277]|uniref:phosphatase PAP2 family protein n=1 Tax=Corynebacterium sp. 13CS0277 TaxID=2071994 RepID=UPI000D0274FA|nr:phosphatase PAP2 family protein [Corynebacterium sp. 13CS0277]PRQ11872.1 phosphatase PAP2 family protein [Corynebacterium sp. 13CS0277]
MASFTDREADLLVALQQRCGTPRVLQAARGLSHFGEHALGWFALAGAGMLLDRRHRWATVGVSAFVSHAASVVLKRVVRRRRPHDPRITVGVATPSNYSFPSSHATSTAGALVAAAVILRTPWPVVGVPVMMASRMVLGVHYPSDVACGAAVGAATAALVARKDFR